MFRRILIPTDFSTASEWAFDDALRIAASTGGELLVLHVRRTWSTDPAALRFPADASLYEYAEQLELDKLLHRAHALHADVNARMIVRQAPEAGPEICRTARDENADLIVISIHASHHVAHLFVGSTTKEVLSDAPAPVLAVRYGTRKRQSMRRLLVPIHLEQSTTSALELAAAVARKGDGELRLLTVCEDDEPRAIEHLRSLASTIEGVAVSSRVILGSDSAKEIVRQASREDVDAIFINGGQSTGERKLEIIRHSPAPVMIVPEHGSFG